MGTRERWVARWTVALVGGASMLLLGGCGTLTGIPAHGGGKRFATEQRLVSASIRSALMDLDVTPLQGKRAALVFDLVADEGGGTLHGGRWSPGLLFSAGTLTSPVTTTSNAFQIYNLADAGTNYSNTASGGGTTTVGTTLQSGSNSGTSTTNATGTNSSSGTTTNSGTSNGTSSSVTGGTATNSNFSQTDSSTGTSAGSGSNTSNSATNSSGASDGRSTSTSTTRNTGTNRSEGGYQTQRQEITPSPTETVSVTEGSKREHTATLQYRGLGEYQNFPVPKSDASLLMGLVRNYFMLNGVIPTTPNDPTAEVLVYVTVDIFGTVRSRFDALVFNNETVKAETSFEIMAFDRDGRTLLKPQVSNREARYQEYYLLWAGPVTTKEKVMAGQGLLVDFTRVDGTQGSYNPAAPVERTYPMGKH